MRRPRKSARRRINRVDHLRLIKCPQRSECWAPPILKRLSQVSPPGLAKAASVMSRNRNGDFLFIEQLVRKTCNVKGNRAALGQTSLPESILLSAAEDYAARLNDQSQRDGTAGDCAMQHRGLAFHPPKGVRNRSSPASKSRNRLI